MTRRIKRPAWLDDYRKSDLVEVPLALLDDCWGALRLLQLHLWKKHGVGRRTGLLMDVDEMHARLQYFGVDPKSEHIITWLYQAEQLEAEPPKPQGHHMREGVVASLRAMADRIEKGFDS